MSIVRLPNPDDPSDYRYLVWSSVVDAPVTYGMTREELEAFTLEEDGKRGLRDLPARLERCDRKGTSSFMDTSWRHILVMNHAGPDGSEIGHREFWRYYVEEREGPKHCRLPKKA